MFSLHFDQPRFGHLLWLVLAMLVALLWLEVKRNRILDRFVSVVMQERLVQRLGLSYRIFSIVLFSMALAFFVLALMRPQWGETVRSIPRVSAQIMVCLDVSKSMLAEDVKPNRMERAKAELSDLLTLMDGDQIGLTAFAGKATVACPMTTDFGFLRLILKDIGPHSAGLGGTKLSEPIRLATEGFGEGADISRVLLLITDGGDHDSFPVEAADEARKRGIRIITVGFGDEAGSRIELTNPQTGETDFVRDQNGEPVVSKLNGDLLRQLALDTNGVYIPAGTGALDLESIYREHIVPLTRSRIAATQEVVRNEAYFVPIAFGLVCLAVSMLVTGCWSPSFRLTPSGPVAMFIALLLVLKIQSPAPAQVAPAQVAPAQVAPAQDAAAVSEANSSSRELTESTESTDSQNPRETYNAAVRHLDTDLEKADSYFQAARSAAGSDGEIRFRSAYNLGWVEIKRADKLLDSDPERALIHLQTAVDWFNRAIRIRPKDKDARHNLEVVMRRAIELADSLAKKNEEDFDKRLDKLIEQQRILQVEVGEFVELGHAASDEDLEGSRFRDQLRQLAVRQRQLLADANLVFEDASNELQKLDGQTPDEIQSEQQQRSAQLAFATNYLQQATQRMGQARSQLRLRQQDRAYRRQSSSLEKLKRARDVFRDPAERIRVLLQDAMPLHLQTLTYAGGHASIADDTGHASQVPAWLTHELLTELQESIADRTSELSDQIVAGIAELDNTEDEGNASDKAPDEPMSDMEKQRWQTVSQQMESATKAFGEANAALTAKQMDATTTYQFEAIKALRKAEEQLLDYRGLIERAFTDQSRLQGLLGSTQEVASSETFEELVTAITEFQADNKDRIQRVQTDLQGELDKLENQATDVNDPAPNQSAPDPEQMEKELEKFRKAVRLSQAVARDMDSALQAVTVAVPNSAPKEHQEVDATHDSVELPVETEPVSIEDGLSESHPFYATSAHSQSAIDNLQQLRRLFFTIVQRLQESAQIQSNINDETVNLVVENEFPIELRGPIGIRQSENRRTAEQLANELAEQAAAAGSAASGPPTADQQTSAEQTVQNYQQASELVTIATNEMANAETQLQVDNDFDLKSAQQHQQMALEKLLEAVKLLQPPNDDSEDQQDQSNDQQQDENQEPEESDSEQQQSQNQSNAMLQVIRDREAQRRDEKAKRARRLVPANGPDW